MTIQAKDPGSERGGNALGVLAIQHLHYAREAGWIESADDPKAYQPSSLDLTVGSRYTILPYTFLPGSGDSVAAFTWANHYPWRAVDGRLLLRPKTVYLFELQERFNLPFYLAGRTNAKSSVGRTDVFVRVLTESADEYDFIPSGYKGKLYALVISRSFFVVVDRATRLVQARFIYQGSMEEPDNELNSLFEKDPPIDSPNPNIKDGIWFSPNLEGENVTYVSLPGKAPAPVELTGRGQYLADDYWIGLRALRGNRLQLSPQSFHLIASAEKISIPPEYCGEMIAVDVGVGESRFHCAGFFDAGFGYKCPSDVVAECRVYDMPMLLRHRQPCFRFKLYKHLAPPDRLYGQDDNGQRLNSYQGQTGVRLAKWFYH